MNIDRAKLLKRSGVGIAGPWLVIAPPGNPVIRLDLRALDHVDVRSNGKRRARSRPASKEQRYRRRELLLIRGECVVALYIADGAMATRRIARNAAKMTRSAMGRGQSPDLKSCLFVGEHPVFRRGRYIHVGPHRFRLHEVEEYSRQGANIPLIDGGLLQAAVVMLIVRRRTTR